VSVTVVFYDDTRLQAKPMEKSYIIMDTSALCSAVHYL